MVSAITGLLPFITMKFKYSGSGIENQQRNSYFINSLFCDRSGIHIPFRIMDFLCNLIWIFPLSWMASFNLLINVQISTFHVLCEYPLHLLKKIIFSDIIKTRNFNDSNFIFIMILRVLKYCSF